MKIIHAIIALAIATLCTATFSFAHGEDEGMEERHIKLLVMDGSESIEIDGSDLAVGDSQQLLTDSGKEVIISREEDGYTVTIDGEEIQIGGGHHMKGLLHGMHDSHSKIFVKHCSDGGGDGHKCIGADGEIDVLIDQDFEWHETDGKHRVMVMGMGDLKSPAQRLLDSGVLDKVDDETREEILEVLRDATPHRRIGAHRIFIEKHGDGDEEDGED